MAHILLYCRAGFEPECGQEIIARAAQVGLAGEAQGEANSGVVLFTSTTQQDRPLWQRLSFTDLVFTRQWVFVADFAEDLPARDRLTPLLELAARRGPFGEVFVEHADTNEAKTLSPFCRKFSPLFNQAALQSGVLQPQQSHALPRLHLFFLDAARCYVGTSPPANASAWPMGIPRVRFPPGAPSRSTLKLAEAFMVFLSADEQQQRLRAGRRAVDLGAAPGGWSWQFASRGMRVDAIDNGPMSQALMATGLVQHARQDGFRYRPKRPVDWMVCDMVEMPSRVAQLVAEWVARGDCRESIFNLKLPMKKRHMAVEEARQLIGAILGKAHVAFDLGFKQLYHDREEVTGHLRRLTDARQSSTRKRPVRPY